MRYLYYYKTGLPVSDYKISEFVDNFLVDPFYEDEEHGSAICTALVIDEIRARIAEGRINPDDITIMVEDSYFNIDSNGRSSDWSEPLKVHSNILDRLIKTHIPKRN